MASGSQPIIEMPGVLAEFGVTDADLLEAEFGTPVVNLPRQRLEHRRIAVRWSLGGGSVRPVEIGVHGVSVTIPYNFAMNIDSQLALYTAASVRALDDYAIGTAGIAGLTLMRRAAGACVDVLRERWPGASSVLVCCGSGNNAGDGYIVAGMLADKGLDVTAIAVGNVDKLGSDASQAYRYCCNTSVTFGTLDDISPDEFDVIVDALLGIGIQGQVRPDYLDVIAWMNQSNRPVLAVDIPSGLCADTGMRLGDAVSADVTVTFIGRKQGVYTLDGPDCAGELRYADLGVPPQTFDAVAPDATMIDLTRCLAALPARPKNAHKNRFGHVLVIGGDEGMGGAVSMCAEAALRAGAGLVSVATHPSHVNAILARRPELMVRGAEHPDDLAPLLARASVVALGAGLGRSSWSSRIFKKAMEVTREEALPVVLDADGLNLLALHPQARDDWVLTPHPGEASNLLQDNRIQQDRFAAVRGLREHFGGVVLLKGCGTLVAADDGISVCGQGNPGMSTAGMGDVLGGLIAALRAQGLEANDATRLGVVVHAIAGDRCAAASGERGIVATDLLPHIRRMLNPDRSE